jgi:signal transduction histidine kinase
LPATADEAVAKMPFSIATGGIHLALARALSQSVGARLRLEQVPGRGSHFTVTVPKES